MKSNQRGFTLLELLIGITLMALIMMAVVIGLRIAVRAWQQGQDRISLVDQQEEQTGFMAKQIESLMPFKVESTDPKLSGQFVILEAQPFCFRFLSTYGSRFRNRSGLILAEYGLTDATNGARDLYVREGPVGNDEVLLHQIILRAGQDPDTGKFRILYRPFVRSESTLLLRKGMQAARFDYLVPATQTKPAQWISDWQPEPNREFPTAVRMTWEEDGRPKEVVFPVRAHSIPNEKNG